MNFTSVSDGDASDFGCEWNIPTMSSPFSSALLYPSNSCSFEIVKLISDLSIFSARNISVVCHVSSSVFPNSIAHASYGFSSFACCFKSARNESGISIFF